MNFLEVVACMIILILLHQMLKFEKLFIFLIFMNFGVNYLAKEASFVFPEEELIRNYIVIGTLSTLVSDRSWWCDFMTWYCRIKRNQVNIAIPILYLYYLESVYTVCNEKGFFFYFTLCMLCRAITYYGMLNPGELIFCWVMSSHLSIPLVKLLLDYNNLTFTLYSFRYLVVLIGGLQYYIEGYHKNGFVNPIR